MKRMVKRVASVSLAAAVAATAGSQALAVGWQPSRTQNEVEVVESVVSTGIGAQVAVTAGPSINPATGSILQVQQSQDAVIQVTPVSQTLAVNNAINAANPGLSAGQLSANPTASGLSYAANGQLNNLYNLVQCGHLGGGAAGGQRPCGCGQLHPGGGRPGGRLYPSGPV